MPCNVQGAGRSCWLQQPANEVSEGDINAQQQALKNALPTILIGASQRMEE
jgi:hypothetical protein